MILIIHHWDADGICSASLMLSYFERMGYRDVEVTNTTPEIGKFSLDDRVYDLSRDSKRIVVLDLNMVDEVEKLLSEVKKPLTFIDHHIQRRLDLETEVKVEHINPFLDGEDAISTTFVVSNHYGVWSYLTAIGAVGDIGKRAFNNRIVRELLERVGIDYDTALRLVELIDSNYIVMDRIGVENAVKMLVQEDIRDLLENKHWNDNLEKIRGEVLEATSNLREIQNGFAIVEFESSMNIISKVARMVIWDMGYERVVAVNRGFEEDQIYIRAIKNDLTPLCDMLREAYNAGGKSEVVGVLTPKSKTDEVRDMVVKWLKK